MLFSNDPSGRVLREQRISVNVDYAKHVACYMRNVRSMSVTIPEHSSRTTTTIV